MPTDFASLNPFQLASMADCASPDSAARPTDGLRCPDCGREWPNVTDPLLTDEAVGLSMVDGHYPPLDRYEDPRKPYGHGDRCTDTPTPATVPVGDDSPGAAFLRSVAYSFDPDEYREATYPDDRLHEWADGAVPIYTHTVWTTFADLAAYNEDPVGEGLADGTDLTNTAQIALYLIAARLLRALADELPTVYGWRFDPEPDEDGDYAVTLYHAHPGTDEATGNAYDAGDEVETDYLRADQFEGMTPEAVAILLPTMARTFAQELAEQNDGELAAEVPADA